MSRRSMARRLERLEGLEVRVGPGGRMINVEFYDELPDGTLVRLPELEDEDHVEGLRTIQVVFVYPKHHVDAGGELAIESKAEIAKGDIASADDVDAVAPTFASGVTPGSVPTRRTYWKPPPARMSRNGWLG
jgi:hypothetical protein